MSVLLSRSRSKHIQVGSQGGGGAYSPIGASFDAVYTQNLYSDFGVSSTAAAIHSVTRASTKYVEDTSGLWTSVSANTLARSNKGALIEESRTNSIRNNSMQGAVAGTPGTTPTNWLQGSPVVTQVVGVGVEDGIEYIDLRFTGVAADNMFISPDTGLTQVAAANLYTASAFVKLISGSLAPLGGSLSIRIADLAPSVNISGPVTIVPTSASLSSQRFKVSKTTQAATTSLRFDIFSTTAASGAYDITLRIGWPQLELGAFATSPIRTTSAAATRAADVITIDPKYASLAQGSAFVEWQETLGPIGVERWLWRLGAGTDNTVGMRITAGNKVEFIVVNATVTQAQLVSTNNVVSGQVYKAAVRWGTNDTASALTASLQAAVATDVTATMPSGTPVIALGHYAGGLAPLNQYLRRVTFFPRKLGDAELGALVA